MKKKKKCILFPSFSWHLFPHRKAKSSWCWIVVNKGLSPANSPANDFAGLSKASAGPKQGLNQQWIRSNFIYVPTDLLCRINPVPGRAFCSLAWRRRGVGGTACTARHGAAWHIATVPGPLLCPGWSPCSAVSASFGSQRYYSQAGR